MSHSVNSILSQIRSYQSQVAQAAPTGDVARGNAIGGLGGLAGTQPTAAPSFSQTLQGALAGVNQAQQTSSTLAAAFERGDPNADLARVMVASQQSQLAFRATVEVRNRLVQAYQDVMNMPL
ncbi:flagellar hook-basal body protein [Stenotrophomonas daejeonensis]|uniref:Flagellar hook-basal body complex protein FliE n=1 Tax=Stenotrophomonas daejeonensis TaxID=659018 RepID=A0A0R0E959_9GAMM|nr:flagellar hook-basal body complex protein FliE [Stenotrophomonas daejeonensis]KRG87922.1 flagellar hook-basal body protein [Stenotrophomonas daejeonensis]